MSDGGSARRRADELLAQAAAARAQADALEHEAGAWQAGADGERRVATELAKLPASWQVLHDRLLRPGQSLTNIDHIVIGPSGLYLIDSKNWAGAVSVYNGTLWQHNGASRCRTDALKQVLHAGAEVESAIGLPVTPMIVLAGASSAKFLPCRVEGVEVVPARKLRSWLNAQRRDQFVKDPENLARTIALTFPPASPERGSGRTDGDNGGWANHSTSNSRSPRTRVPSGRKPKPGSRRSGSSIGTAFFKLALLVTALTLVTQVVLPFLSNRASQVAQTMIPKPSSSPLCDRVTNAMIKQSLGDVSATPQQTFERNTCRWTLTRRATPGTFPLSWKFGEAAKLDVDVIGRGKPAAGAQNGIAIARVSAGQSLEAWSQPRPKSPEPFGVDMRYPLPTSGKASDVEKRNAQAASLKSGL
ncbi:MAG: nuclease-related domain-containing protein [Intrasporangium sp.]|uniref:nuclease-related domain-containing protein n=1 Tax=Intrasporangium sp. TaxID=1925024 RepID=UPI003F815FF8